MATSLAAVRLQPWPHQQPEVVHKFMEVAHGYGSSTGVRVRALGGKTVGTSQPRGRICRVPLFRTPSFPRREALVSAMSEEHDITDMQETDKVSGEWWKPILTAVHDWSQDKLLGLAELADGSLFFSFGPEAESKASPKASSSPQLKAHSESTPPLKTTTLPQRHPSSFRKHSPIPASRKKASELKKTVKEEAAPTAQPPKPDNNKAPKKEKAKRPSKATTTQPQRPPSSFSKRSPIPKHQVPASISKKKSQETTPSTTAFDSAKDSPLSPELKEILNRGKESAKSKTDAKTSTSGGPPAKKKASKVVREETVVEVVQTDAAAVESEETTVEVVQTVAAAVESEETTVEVVQTVAAAVESEETTVEVADENGAVSKDLGSYKLPELRSLAKARGLKGYSKLKKGELVDLLAGLES